MRPSRRRAAGRAIKRVRLALFYLSVAFGAVAIATGFDGRVKPVLLVIGLVAFLSTAVWYEMAIISTSYYANTVQALVNLGRIKLANEMGLEMPATIEHERRMWWLLKSFLYHNEEAVIGELNLYRSRCTVRRCTVRQCTVPADRSENVGEAPSEHQGDEEQDESEIK
jgi:hypothetical protein